MHWTIDEESPPPPSKVWGFEQVTPGHLACTHVLHGLTLSRKLRMQLEDPTDVRLVTEISEFHTGNFRPKIEASIEIYERTHLLRLAEAPLNRAMAANVVRQTVGDYSFAVRSGAKLSLHTVKQRLLRALLWRMRLGWVVCGEHDDCMANDALGSACAKRAVTILLKAARNET